MISIHALRVEGDRSREQSGQTPDNFYPRPPGGGRPTLIKLNLIRSAFLSTPSGWRATITASFVQLEQFPISIHALRVEGDLTKQIADVLAAAEFLSTPSGWRATTGTASRSTVLRFLSTPSGWRATKALQGIHAKKPAISIHALRVEGDAPFRGRPRIRCSFLSTPSGWRATIKSTKRGGRRMISIHALRVEGDFRADSHLSATPMISIHALRVEGDRKKSSKEP